MYSARHSYLFRLGLQFLQKPAIDASFKDSKEKENSGILHSDVINQYETNIIQQNEILQYIFKNYNTYIKNDDGKLLIPGISNNTVNISCKYDYIKLYKNWLDTYYRNHKYLPLNIPHNSIIDIDKETYLNYFACCQDIKTLNNCIHQNYIDVNNEKIQDILHPDIIFHNDLNIFEKYTNANTNTNNVYIEQINNITCLLSNINELRNSNILVKRPRESKYLFNIYSQYGIKALIEILDKSLIQYNFVTNQPNKQNNYVTYCINYLDFKKLEKDLGLLFYYNKPDLIHKYNLKKLIAPDCYNKITKYYVGNCNIFNIHLLQDHLVSYKNVKKSYNESNYIFDLPIKVDSLEFETNYLPDCLNNIKKYSINHYKEYLKILKKGNSEFLLVVDSILKYLSDEKNYYEFLEINTYYMSKILEDYENIILHLLNSPINSLLNINNSTISDKISSIYLSTIKDLSFIDYDSFIKILNDQINKEKIVLTHKQKYYEKLSDSFKYNLEQHKNFLEAKKNLLNSISFLKYKKIEFYIKYLESYKKHLLDEKTIGKLLYTKELELFFHIKNYFSIANSIKNNFLSFLNGEIQRYSDFNKKLINNIFTSKEFLEYRKYIKKEGSKNIFVFNKDFQMQDFSLEDNTNIIELEFSKNVSPLTVSFIDSCFDIRTIDEDTILQNTTNREALIIYTDTEYNKKYIPTKNVSTFYDINNKNNYEEILSLLNNAVINNKDIYLIGSNYGTIETQQILYETLNIINNSKDPNQYIGYIHVELRNPIGLDSVETIRFNRILKSLNLNNKIIFTCLLSPMDYTLAVGNVFGIDFGTEILHKKSRVFINNKYLHIISDYIGFYNRIENSQKIDQDSFFTVIKDIEKFSAIKKILYPEAIYNKDTNCFEISCISDLEDLYKKLENSSKAQPTETSESNFVVDIENILQTKEQDQKCKTPKKSLLKYFFKKI